jgi:hypothetical protein
MKNLIKEKYKEWLLTSDFEALIMFGALILLTLLAFIYPTLLLIKALL